MEGRGAGVTDSPKGLELTDPRFTQHTWEDDYDGPMCTRCGITLVFIVEDGRVVVMFPIWECEENAR